MRSIFLAVIINSFFVAHSYAAQVGNQYFDGRNGALVLSGAINAGDAVRFREAAFKRVSNILILDSPGGILNDGLEIAQAVRDLGLTTAVPATSGCYSVCALIWVAGVNRVMSRAAQIGFHAAYYRENGVAKETGVGNARVGAFLTRIGLPEAAVIYMTVAPPNDFAPLTPEVAKKIGVEFSYFDPPKSAQPTKETSPEKNLSFVSGLDPNGDNWLALKSSPSLSSRRLAKLPPDTLLRLIGQDGDWVQVELTDGRRGWVAKRYVSCCK